MKKINAEEAAKIVIIRTGKSTWLYKELAKLAVGEALIIENADWKTKLPPYRTIRNAAKTLKMKFDYGKMPDGSGWVVKRVK